MSEELFGRIHILHQVCDQLQGGLAQEKEDRGKAEKRIASLEAEMSGIDSRWERELEKKQTTISTLQTHCSKQSAAIVKLREEAAKNKTMAESSQRDAVEQRECVVSLEKELESEKQARLSAQESAHSSQLALQGLKLELDASKAAHQKALADAQNIEARLNFMTSEEGRKEVIESYRLGPIGKMEVTLVAKAGFDYLKAQLPQDAIPSPGPVYPHRVHSCLDMLLELQKKGAGIQLYEDGGDDNDEDEDDKDDDDEEETGGGDGSS